MCEPPCISTFDFVRKSRMIRIASELLPAKYFTWPSILNNLPSTLAFSLPLLPIGYVQSGLSEGLNVGADDPKAARPRAISVEATKDFMVNRFFKSQVKERRSLLF